MRKGAEFSAESVAEEARLVYFLNGYLIPALQSDTKASQRANSEIFGRARILETFLWLHHGVEIQYFPIASARRVMYEYFDLFLRAYESPIAKQNIETWFSPAIRAIFTTEFNGNTGLFSQSETRKGVRAVDDVHSVFETFLLLASDFNRTATVLPLIEALVVPDPKVWELSIRKFIDLSASPEHHDAATVETIDRLSDGFLEIVRYLQEYRRASSDVRRASIEDASKDYLRLFKETQQWRLNFGYPIYRERFLELASLAGAILSKNASDKPHSDSEFLKKLFLREIFDLMTDWGAQIKKAAGA